MSKMHTKSGIDGYVTVEASLLLPLIFGILWTLLYLMFYVLESAWISGTMEECVILYGPYQTKAVAENCGIQADGLLGSRQFFAQNRKIMAQNKGDKLKLTVSASHILPIRRQITVQTGHPIEEIRRREWIEEAIQNRGD